jgi:beta-lactamase regulating signal transducer with metallopeptidase domain
MISYILKSVSCLALLLFFYHLLLEKEKMHAFNRFYLLIGVIVSLLVPFATITVDVIPETLSAIQMSDQIIFSDNYNSKIVEETISYTHLFIGIYSLISSILFIRLGRNLFKIIQKIRLNKKIKYQNATLVLVNEKILPHTFWKAIFINKKDYENNKIEKELFTHELTHVTQKHTFDVLIIELLQIVFWINPLFIFLKKAIQLNHEFLADQTVINQHKNTFQYQHLLLNIAAWNNEYYLASNLNYSLTKKRLKMMTTKRSNRKVLLKKLAVIPLLTGLIFLFANRIEAQEIVETTIIETKEIKKIKKNQERNSYLTQQEKIKTFQGELDKKHPTTGFKNINGKKYFYVERNEIKKYYNRKGQLVDSNGKIISRKQISASDVIKGQFISKVYDAGVIVCEFKNNTPSNYSSNTEYDLREVLENIPPPKISPLDFVKKQKNKNVDYFYNKKKINYKKALHLIQNNRPINIESKKVNGKMIINLSKEIEEIKEQNKGKNIFKDDSKKYQKLNKLFEAKRKQDPHYTKSNPERKKELENLYSKLSKMYYNLSKEDKKRLKKAIHLHYPFTRLSKKNKVFYKLSTELTEADKLLIPPPPPHPNASKEEIIKAKKAYKDWKKRTGNDGAPPPPKKKKALKVVKGTKSDIPPPPPPLKNNLD